MAATELRRQLEERLEQLTRRTQRVERDLRSPHDDDWAERAQQIENDEVLERLDDDGQAEIAEIRAALRRIDDGSFGTCSECGAQIEEARLRVLPYARSCIGCA